MKNNYVIPYFPIKPFISGIREGNSTVHFTNKNSFDTEEEALAHSPTQIVHLSEKEMDILNENLANFLFASGRQFFPHLTYSCLVSLMAALYKIYQA
jgi:hypothetical protein